MQNMLIRITSFINESDEIIRANEQDSKHFNWMNDKDLTLTYY